MSERHEGRFEQPGWTAESVINAGTVHIDVHQPPQRPRASAGRRRDRRSLAKHLVRSLTHRHSELAELAGTAIDLTVLVDDLDRDHGRRKRLRLRKRYTMRPLSEALSRRTTDLTLLQGGPGTGKSLALRLYARDVLDEIARSGSHRVPLPIYVNLRDLTTGPKEINSRVLEQYIAEQVNPGAAPELTGYFARDFAADLRNGSVILLLDSFDEIPAVLGSATVDAAVRPYVAAVIALVGGGGARCVVAAREYKGPPAADWSRLHLLGMSPDEQSAFLVRQGLPQERIGRLRPLLTDPRRGFAAELRNPLALSLMAAHVRRTGLLPDRPSELYASFAEQRLSATVEAQDAAAVPSSRTSWPGSPSISPTAACRSPSPISRRCSRPIPPFRTNSAPR
ncbi:NACHT domain-containing protein [Actinocorallia longicatena]|uniref:NACHT domain-containing protein n=1 Tax=Actinocorallia longicatena TaxID=111803 RepID=A0ABP6PZV9_9ACTN